MTETLTEWSVAAYEFLLPWAWIGLAVAVVVLSPLAIFRKTRGYAGIGLFVVSFLFGATTWFFSAAVTLASLGLGWVIIGVLLFGVGVVPLGIIGALFVMDSWSIVGSIVGMVVVVYAARVGGGMLVEST